MNTNKSELTWVLVWDGTTKEVIEIVPPGDTTSTLANLQEFDTEDELNQFISNNNLIIPE